MLDVLPCGAVKATDWSATSAGNLLTGSNWSGGVAPNATDAIANISTQPTSFGSFALFGTITLGELDYSNSGIRSITGTGGILNLDTSAGTPTISVTGGKLTIGNRISGSDGMNKTGSSTLVLTGDNTYSGTTTISAGTVLAINSTGSATGSSDITIDPGAILSVGDPSGGSGATSGAVSGNITNNGTLEFYRSDTITYAGNISGSGTLVKENTGTVVLTGNNTFTGGVTLNNGTLSLGSILRLALPEPSLSTTTTFCSGPGSTRPTIRRDSALHQTRFMISTPTARAFPSPARSHRAEAFWSNVALAHSLS